MRVVPVAAAMLLALALSGCSWDDLRPGGSGGKVPTQDLVPPNRAPTAQLMASIANGTTPLNVTFGLAGTDADGDALNWTLVLEDGVRVNGTGLPTNLTHTFTDAGDRLVALEVTDGHDVARANVTVRVAAPPPAPAAVFAQAQQFPSSPAASATVPVVGYAGAAACAGFWDGTSGFDCVFFALEAAWEGHAFNATADEGDPDLEFWPACDPREVFAMSGSAGDGPEAGTIPPGARCVVLWNGQAGLRTPTHTFVIA